MKKDWVNIEDCQEHMVLSEDLYNEAGLLLLTKGTCLTRDKVGVMVRRGVTCVPVKPPQVSP